MGRYWAINLWIVVQKVIAVVVAIGSVWVFIELEIAAGNGIRELSFIGIVIGTDATTAIHLAPVAILIRGLVISLLLYASAQFLHLLVDLMISANSRLRRDEVKTPPQGRRDLWAED